MDTVKIGKRLIALRGARRREEIAFKLGISASALTMYELGLRTPRDPVKVEIAKLYGKKVEEIFFA